MSANAKPGGPAKYAWQNFSRVEPPKRSVANRVLDFQATSAPYDEATAREQASRCIQCPNPNCVTVCPLETPLVDLLALTADGQFKEAAELLFAANALPELASHICVSGRVCETVCVLGAKSEPVPIRAITRFLLDYGWKHGLAEPTIAAPNGKRVAVIGSGICGLVGADTLSRLGYAVTVIDSRQRPGGRMVNGLPGFRMDTGMVERRIELLQRRGIQFRMGLVCGRDIHLNDLRREFDAVLLGFTRSDAVPLSVPGANLPGVHQADLFVLQNARSSKLEKTIDVRGKQVAVLGGGDTAMDALRIAIRCGASRSVCVYRRDAANLAADAEEYANAVEEGAEFQFLSQPVAIVGNTDGKVVAARCVRTELGEPEISGRRGAKLVVESQFDVPAELVLVAYGFTAARLPRNGGFGELATDGHGHVMVDAKQMTNLAGVFAAGSVIRGSVPLADVVRDARKAAKAIDGYLAKRAK